MIYLDLRSEIEPFSLAVARGLRCSPKRIAPKYFYDPRGSALFEEICNQPEYYPTRTEIGILQKNIGQIGSCIPKDSLLIEFGSGASIKTRILLEHAGIRSYVPLDISREFLLRTAEDLRIRYPEISILPACGDFTREMTIPPFILRNFPSRVAFLPGSTIGNFDPIEAARILRSIRKLLGSGLLLVGVDLMKDPGLIESAYNDAAGITSAFNKNLIIRIQEEAGAGILPEDFMHRAFFNSALGRIEMHLVACRDLGFEIAGEGFHLKKDESIHTENSYKYAPSRFEALCEGSGFSLVRFWCDPKEWFGVFLLRVDNPEADESISLEYEAQFG